MKGAPQLVTNRNEGHLFCFLTKDSKPTSVGLPLIFLLPSLPSQLPPQTFKSRKVLRL